MCVFQQEDKGKTEVLTGQSARRQLLFTLSEAPVEVFQVASSKNNRVTQDSIRLPSGVQGNGGWGDETVATNNNNQNPESTSSQTHLLMCHTMSGCLMFFSQKMSDFPLDSVGGVVPNV